MFLAYKKGLRFSYRDPVKVSKLPKGHLWRPSYKAVSLGLSLLNNTFIMSQYTAWAV